MCFALIHNVTLRVRGFQGKTPTLRGPERLGQPFPRNAKSARLAAFDKIGNLVSFTYSQMTAQQFMQLDVYSRHLYFMKIGHEINCCVFKSREWSVTNKHHCCCLRPCQLEQKHTFYVILDLLRQTFKEDLDIGGNK